MFQAERTLCTKPQSRIHMPPVRSRMSDSDKCKETESGGAVKSTITMTINDFPYVSKSLQSPTIHATVNVGQTRSPLAKCKLISLLFKSGLAL